MEQTRRCISKTISFAQLSTLLESVFDLNQFSEKIQDRTFRICPASARETTAKPVSEILLRLEFFCFSCTKYNSI